MVAYICGHFLDRLSWAAPRDQRGARFGWKVPALAPTGRWKLTKKNTSEAITSLKKKDRASKTNSKRTQNEPPMSAANAEFEPETPHFGKTNSNPGVARRGIKGMICRLEKIETF